LTCKLVKTLEDFRENGCDNCSEYDGPLDDYTTQNFHGLVAIMKPETSWVARVQRADKKGLYAIVVVGKKPNGD